MRDDRLSFGLPISRLSLLAEWPGSPVGLLGQWRVSLTTDVLANYVSACCVQAHTSKCSLPKFYTIKDTIIIIAQINRVHVCLNYLIGLDTTSQQWHTLKTKVVEGSFSYGNTEKCSTYIPDKPMYVEPSLDYYYWKEHSSTFFSKSVGMVQNDYIQNHWAIRTTDDLVLWKRHIQFLYFVG